MSPINLTEKHKEKLLEMCSVLFSEIYSTDRNIFDIRDGDNDIPCIMHYNSQTRSWDIFIHWFEFCMTYLVNKIYYPDNIGKRFTISKVEFFFFQSFIDSIEGSTSGYKHPVDYLYEEFKKKS